MDFALLKLRAAKDPERPLCFEIKKAAFRCYIEQVWGWDDAEQIEFHGKDWDAQRPQIITAQGQDIGTIKIRRDGESMAISEFFLLPEFQNQGIGSEILNRLTREADEQRAFIQLDVLKVNPAKSLYLKFGFEETHEDQNHFFMKRKPRPKIGDL